MFLVQGLSVSVRELNLIMQVFNAYVGGYVAADAKVIDFLQHSSRPFIFSASMPPANAATALAALRYLERHPELPLRLKSLGEYARKGFLDRGLKIRESAMEVTTPIIPLYTYTFEETLAAQKRIYDAGVYVNSVVPPATPEGECLLRTSYMASHTEALLDEAMDIIANVMTGR